ncbi:hypothetical protein V8C37DRAFT_126691 [Trichoderma ceciliae]
MCAVSPLQSGHAPSTNPLKRPTRSPSSACRHRRLRIYRARRGLFCLERAHSTEVRAQVRAQVIATGQSTKPEHHHPNHLTSTRTKQCPGFNCILCWTLSLSLRLSWFKLQLLFSFSSLPSVPASSSIVCCTTSCSALEQQVDALWSFTTRLCLPCFFLSFEFAALLCLPCSLCCSGKTRMDTFLSLPSSLSTPFFHGLFFCVIWELFFSSGESSKEANQTRFFFSFP